MPQFMAVVSFTVSLMAFALPAKSSDDGLFDGNTFLSICEDQDMAMQMACTSYTVGLMEGLKFGTANFIMLVGQGDLDTTQLNKRTEQALRICAPQGVTYDQYIRIGIKYLRENPRLTHESVRGHLVQAWSKAFPCG